jgi:hypothetical protein
LRQAVRIALESHGHEGLALVAMPCRGENLCSRAIETNISLNIR